MTEWRQVKLGDLYEVHHGLSKGRQFFGGGYPFVSFSTVLNHWFQPRAVGFTGAIHRKRTDLFEPFTRFFNQRQGLLAQICNVSEVKDRLLPKMMNGEA